MSTRIKVKPDATRQITDTSTYQPAAGKWAIAKVQVTNGGTFSINGNTVLKSLTWNAISSNISPRVHSAGTNATKGMNITINNGGTETTGGGSGSVVATTTDAGDMFANSTANHSQYAEFSILSTDTIQGSGSGNCTIVIEEFYG